MGAGLFIAGIVFVVLGFVGAIVGQSKGRGIEGFFLCLLLGPFGAILLAAMAPSAEYTARRDRERAAALAQALRASGVLEPRAEERAEAEGEPAPEVSFTLDRCAGVGRGDEAPMFSVQPGWVFINVCRETCDNENHELALDPITARLLASRVRDAVTIRLGQQIPAFDGVITIDWFNDPGLQTGTLIDWTGLYLPERVAPEAADAECGWIFLEGDLAEDDGQLIGFLRALDTSTAVAEQWGARTLTEGDARRGLEPYTRSGAAGTR